MSDIRWDLSPNDATHYDNSFCRFCTKNGYWNCADGKYFFYSHVQPTNDSQYIARPSRLTDANGTEWEKVKTHSDGSATFKPIDTRTDTEKAIDDIKRIDQLIHGDHDFNKAFLDAIKSNQIHGVTFTGE